MVIAHNDVAQRDIWWADLGDPIGSTSGFLRPVVIVQSDVLNASRLATYLCVPLTSVVRRTQVPWNIHLPAKSTGLDKDSVAQANQMLTVDQSQLVERTGRISGRELGKFFVCLDIALGRTSG